MDDALVFRFHGSKPFGERCTSWISNTLLRATRERFKEMSEPNGRFFHLLVPQDIEEESSDEEWHGRLVALEKTIKSEAGKHKKALGGYHNTQSQRSVY